MSSSRKSGFEEYVSYRPTPEMLAKIQETVKEIVEECVDKKLEKALSKLLDEKLEKVIQKLLEEKEKKTEPKIVTLEKIPMEEAIKRIEEYIDLHQGCLTSDIIYDLALDPDLVIQALKKLEKDKSVRGENIDS